MPVPLFLMVLFSITGRPPTPKKSDGTLTAVSGPDIVLFEIWQLPVAVTEPIFRIVLPVTSAPAPATLPVMILLIIC